MYTQIASNKRKTWLFLFLFVALIGGLGYAIAGAQGNPTLFYYIGVAALVYSFVSYWFSGKFTLALSGAKEISKADAPELYRVVENLSITAGVPMPKVYLIDDPAPNAFATGRDPRHAAVAATTGLVASLNKVELEGVMAHELGHVGNYDIRLMSVVAALVSVVAFISDFFLRFSFWFGDEGENNNPIMLIIGIVVAILAPLIAVIVQLAISRQREYLADATAALITRYPEGLAQALEKIEAAHMPMKRQSTATAHLYIANPMKKKRGLGGLFSTHPPIEERIARLRGMENHV